MTFRDQMDAAIRQRAELRKFDWMIPIRRKLEEQRLEAKLKEETKGTKD